MGPRVWGVVILLLVGKAVAGEGIDAAASITAVCPKVSLLDSVLPPSASPCPDLVDGTLRVAAEEGDEAALRKAMYLVHSNKDDYVAFLFYASWCPFSKDCRSYFNVLQSLFPSIRHFAFEESSIKRSILSRYGVHGFPTLFLLNSTMRIRYHGSRRINLLTTFYQDVTGNKPVMLDPASLVKTTRPPDEWDSGIGIEPQDCPFSWATSPDKLLQQDTCLAFATVFVTLRFLYFLWPRLVAFCDCAWKRNTRNAVLLRLSQVCFERCWQVCAAINPYKLKNMQGARNAHAKVCGTG